MNETLKNLTRDQLKAMGLDDQQIDAILGAANNNGKSGGLPFPSLKINYDMDFGKPGAYAYNPKKEDKELVGYDYVTETPKIRLLKSVYQYSKFDTTENRPTITSNIFNLKDAKKAYDLKTGTPIAELKKIDDQIKFQRIILGLIEIDGEWKPFIFYTKGSFLFELNDILRKFSNDAHLTHILELGTDKRKKGTVTWFVPTLNDSVELSQQEFMANIKSDADYIKEFDAWINEINASDESKPANTKVAETNQVDDEEDDEIAF